MKKEMLNLKQLRLLLINGNEELIVRIKELKMGLASCESISHIFASYIVDDLDHIDGLLNSNVPERYYISILRNMHEQVILYKYLMHNSNEIELYLGDKMKDFDLINNDSKEDPLKELIKLTQKRITVNSTKEMCKSIDKNHTDKSYLSLYNIYCILSNLMHDSYFQEMLNDVEKTIEETAELEDNGFRRLLLKLSLNSFYETYNDVLAKT